MNSAAIELAVETLRTHGSVRLRVTGTSMMPAIPPSSTALIRHAEIASVLPGDVVLVRRDEGLRMHRVIRVHADSLITRGDALDHDDPPVAASDILGIVIATEPPPLLRTAAIWLGWKLAGLRGAA